MIWFHFDMSLLYMYFYFMWAFMIKLRKNFDYKRPHLKSFTTGWTFQMCCFKFLFAYWTQQCNLIISICCQKFFTNNWKHYFHSLHVIVSNGHLQGSFIRLSIYWSIWISSKLCKIPQWFWLSIASSMVNWIMSIQIWLQNILRVR